MPQSCRDDVILKVWKDDGTPIGSNAGLLRDRYLELSVKDDKHKGARDRLQGAIRDAVVQASPIYQAVYAKNVTSITSPKKDGIFKTNGRMVIGLGGENVLETGLSLQHTYGTPLIPGSALKGLAAHYCDQVWGAIEPKFKLGEEYHETIFGTTEDSGHIVFHDAWITPESLASSLKPDVMTPHHTEYYSEKDGAAPSDYDDPTPITFLSISGSFYVAVSCDVENEEGKKWAGLAFKILTEALKEWGIGGKTNAGYGRLEMINPSTRPAQNAQSDPGSVGSVQPIAKTVTAAPISSGPRHVKGEIVDAKKTEDPKNRGRIWFKADDGFGGIVMFGKPQNIDIGKMARLEISGVMNEGYNFAVPGSREEHESQKRRDSRRRR